MSSFPNTITTPNLFLHLPAQPQTRHLTIIFFVTGNPGLIGYYHNFLHLLAQPTPSPTSTGPTKDTSTNGGRSSVIAGFSLGGFDLPAEPSASSSSDSGDENAAEGCLNQDELERLCYPPAFRRKDVYGLQDQVGLCYARLVTLVEKVRELYYGDGGDGEGEVTKSVLDDTCSGDGRPEVQVTLMGHSVGAYIALEMVRLHHDRSRRRSSDTGTASTRLDFTISTAILLTPTILNIAQSPSGRLATPLLGTLPFLPALLQLASSTLTTLVPSSGLSWLVGRVTGMRAGGEALRATLSFLGSKGAVRQALCLAGEEMKGIGGNEWGEEVWGVLATAQEQPLEKESGKVGHAKGEKSWKAPMLYFWFAQDDHWVADVTREEIINLIDDRFGEEERSCNQAPAVRPEVVIDKSEGLVHAWCIDQSELVAKRVRVWLEEVTMQQR